MYSYLIVSILFCISLLTGCASIKQEASTILEDAETVWHRYNEYVERNEKKTGPYRIQGSLLYSSDSKMRRANVVIWSNGRYPIRLDAMVGLGTVIARMYEDQSERIVYLPKEKNVIISNKIENTLLDLDISLPFNLYCFVALFHGQFYNAFGQIRMINPNYMSNGNIKYILSGGRVSGTLEVSQEGWPIKWDDPTSGWTLDIDYNQKISLPDKIVISHYTKNKLVFTIKSQEFLMQKFSNAQLKLDIPSGVTVRLLGE